MVSHRALQVGVSG